MVVPTHRTRAARGFTLIEVLLVMGILIVLAGLLLPAVNRVRAQAVRTRMAMDLSAIEQALEAFKADQGDYPRVLGRPGTSPPNPAPLPQGDNKGYGGAIALCQALIAPMAGDNKDASLMPPTAATYISTPGFRKLQGGKTYGPYLNVEQFKMEQLNTHPANDPATVDVAWSNVLLDRFDKPILYFPASAAKPNLKTNPATKTRPGPYVDADISDLNNNVTDVSTLYDARDNFISDTFPPGPFGRKPADQVDALARIQIMLGDNNMNGWLDLGETPVEKPFLLWSAGPDQVYGPDAEVSGGSGVLDVPDVEKCDDVTNFR